MFKYLILFVHILIYLDLCLHSLWLWTKQCCPCASSSKGAPAVQLEAQNLIALKKYIENTVSIGLKMLTLKNTKCKPTFIHDNFILWNNQNLIWDKFFWQQCLSHLKNVRTTDTDLFEQEIKANKEVLYIKL